MNLLKVDSTSLPKSSRLSLISLNIVNIVILKSISDVCVSEGPVGVFYYLLFLMFLIHVIWSVHGPLPLLNYYFFYLKNCGNSSKL